VYIDIKTWGFLQFDQIIRKHPFRRVIIECGDSLLRIDQPITTVTNNISAWKWLKYLGHLGD
jgi:hypothetical protein